MTFSCYNHTIPSEILHTSVFFPLSLKLGWRETWIGGFFKHNKMIRKISGKNLKERRPWIFETTKPLLLGSKREKRYFVRLHKSISFYIWLSGWFKSISSFAAIACNSPRTSLWKQRSSGNPSKCNNRGNGYIKFPQIFMRSGCTELILLYHFLS